MRDVTYHGGIPFSQISTSFLQQNSILYLINKMEWRL